MIDTQKKITTWVSIALLLFGMVSGAIAFTVTTNNKANKNEVDIVKVEKKAENNENRLNFHDTKISYIDEIKSDMKDLKEQNTEILIMLGRLEERIGE